MLLLRRNGVILGWLAFMILSFSKSQSRNYSNMCSTLVL
jgi:hypothetical protein